MIDFDRKGLARVVTIKEVIDHPNADRLDIVTIDEWQCVAQKGVYSAGDMCVYFEIDSILPEKIESAIFGKDAKVKLSKSRVKTIKLRGAVSQGLTCPLETLGLSDLKEGRDLTKKLGIGKFVPEVKKGSVLYTGSQGRSADVGNENFKKMRKPSHYKSVGGFPDQLVMITEKIHGCFDYHTKILLADGSSEKIGRIVDNKMDVEVLTMNGSRLSKSKILNWFNNGRTDNWVNVKISPIGTGNSHDGGEISIKCTPNHKFYSTTRSDYIKASDLTHEDIVVHSLSTKTSNRFQEDVSIGKILGNANVISVSEISRETLKKQNKTKYDIETTEHNYFANNVLVHNSSFVAGWVEREDRTIAQRINKFLFGKFQFCWRSMNQQLQGSDTLWHNIKRKLGLAKATKMEDTLYGRMCIKYNLKERLFKGQILTGEIYGSGIQSGYTYGCAEGEQKLAAFGFRQEGVEAEPEAIVEALDEKGIPMVPILFVGTYSKEKVEECTVGASVLDPKTKVREGCVTVPMSGKSAWHGECIVKNINPAYLLKEQSEFN